MLGAERRDEVQPSQLQPTSRASISGTPSLTPVQPMATQEVGREARTLMALTQKAGEVGAGLMEAGMKKDFIKGKMQFQQGKAYDDLIKEGASYGTVAGFQSLRAAKAADSMLYEGLTEIEKTGKQLAPEQYSEAIAERFSSLLTGDTVLDNYLTELSVPVAQKLTEAHVKAHEAWKVQETSSAARDLLLSKATSEDPKDKTMVQDILDPSGPLSSLTPEDQKATILEAVVLELKSGSKNLLSTLGNMQGIRERFSTTAKDESAVLSAYEEYETAAESQFSSEMRTEFMDVYREVRTGKMTYEQGLGEAARITDKYGKGNKTMTSLSENVWGAANANMNRVESERLAAIERYERKMERAAEKQAEQQEILTGAQFAINGQYVNALDTKGKKAAFQLIQSEVIAMTDKAVAAGQIQPTEAESFAQREYAKRLDFHGAVDDTSAAVWTGLFSSNNLLSQDGKINPTSFSAYKQLVALHKLNPGFALQHLKSEDAKDLFSMAVDLDESGDGSVAALTQAAQNLKMQFTPKDLTARIGSPAFREALTTKSLDAIKKELPGYIFGMDRGSVFEWSDVEVEKAATDSKLLQEVTSAARTKLARKPGMSDDQAISSALLDVTSRGAYMFGTFVLPRAGDVYEKMGLSKYKSETGVPFEAMASYLKANGEKLFGRAWYDETIFRQGADWQTNLSEWKNKRLDSVFGLIPDIDVRYGEENGEPVFMVSPILNSGLPADFHQVIRAKDIGKHYDNARAQQDTEKGLVRRGVDATIGATVRALTPKQETPTGGTW